MSIAEMCASFYSEFALWYEQLIPFREAPYLFLRELAGEPGSTVLDAGCGPGHYCGRFRQDGFCSTGVDLDSQMIRAAEASYPQVEFHCMDIAELGSLKHSFRMIYSIGNVIAHLPPDRFSFLLHEVYAALEPGGCWIFQVVNWDYILGLPDYTFPVKTIENSKVSFYRRYPFISGEQITFEAELRSGGQMVFNERVTLYPLTADKFLQKHVAAGFTLAGRYSGFDKTSFRSELDSGLVMVFRKPIF